MLVGVIVGFIVGTYVGNEVEGVEDGNIDGDVVVGALDGGHAIQRAGHSSDRPGIDAHWVI